ncbi:MAG TPA: PAS-domain containing protein [Rhizomicrobium sp.]|jgi:signal transduction histidine kinase|nr:PAS-domain containing protein [Rhizomicrobium sp.]
MRPILGLNQDNTSKAARFVFAVALLGVSSPASASLIAPEQAGPVIGAGAIALAVGAALWAAALVGTARKLRRQLHKVSVTARSSITARDALLAAARDSVVVWNASDGQAWGYGAADDVVQSCLAGANSAELAEALARLNLSGTSFRLEVRNQAGESVLLRGEPVGSMATVWVEKNGGRTETDFRAVLDAIPIPVWVRDPSCALRWGNRAFLAAVDHANVETARADQPSLERSERELAAAARAEGQTSEAKRSAVINGQRRALALTHVPIANGEIVGVAVDVTDLSNTEARLQQHIDAHADTLDKLATAVSIFDSERKLAFYNGAYARLWNVSESWLDSHPADEEILDRLREERKLPEQRDYQEWKRRRLALYGESTGYVPDELWYQPGGRVLRVIAQPHPFGGLTFLYEDVTEKLALESSYNTLIKVQSATLDTLSEAVAVFGPDARLKLHNAAFARLWELEPADLSGEPHVQKLAQVCIARFGDAAMWQKLALSIASGSERNKNWGQIERSDRKVLALAFAPLPDGATLITFTDVTDRLRIESALRDRAEALEAADRLKSDFVHHASFLFRDPLNAVHGFATLLATGRAGALNDKQREYVSDILTASDTLADVTSDILDLALIDSGALRLTLDRLDLHQLLSRVAESLRKHADGLGISFRCDWDQSVGEIVADERRLRQVLFSLLSNAFRYTPRDGTVVLSASISGEELRICVSDSGFGIAQEVKASVFDTFSARGRSGRPAGAGLGLALVNRFVELHGGWVEIESAPGRGTTVTCHIPRRTDLYEPAAQAG